LASAGAADGTPASIIRTSVAANNGRMGHDFVLLIGLAHVY
jgi:hypothetical protein